MNIQGGHNINILLSNITIGDLEETLSRELGGPWNPTRPRLGSDMSKLEGCRWLLWRLKQADLVRAIQESAAIARGVLLHWAAWCLSTEEFLSDLEYA